MLAGPSGLAQSDGLTLELNRLEERSESCGLDFVVRNESQTHYQSLKLTLILFKPDGVIGKWVSVNLAPVEPAKTVAKTYSFRDVKCSDIGNILVNEITECADANGPVSGCLSRMTLKSLSNVQLTK